jgi:hypothetical protein
MQATKDTFYLTLRDRLAQSYPARTITVDGGTRPAIVVAENDKPSVTARLRDAFYLEWGEARCVLPAISTLMAITCNISYVSAGTDGNGGVDRGRCAAELETELMGISRPAMARKIDYAGSDVDLGSTIFWTAPAFRPVKVPPNCIGREASVTVYFYPEVNQA